MDNIPETTLARLHSEIDEAAEVLTLFRLLSPENKIKILYMIKGAVLTNEPLINR